MPENNNPNRRALDSLTLRNFKSVRDQTIPLSPLTILVGANSAGKSSVIQSILFLAQNSETPTKHSLSAGTLQLNGDLVGLGTYSDALYDGAAAGETIHIGGQLQIIRSHDRGLKYSKVGFQKKELRVADPIVGSNCKFQWELGLTESKTEKKSGLVESMNSSGKLYLQPNHKDSILGPDFNSGELSVQEILVKNQPKAAKIIEWLFPQDKYNLHRSGSLISQGFLESASKNDSTWFVRLPKKLDLVGIQYIMGLPVNGLTRSNRLEVLMKSQSSYFKGLYMRRHVRQFIEEIMNRLRVQSEFKVGLQEWLGAPSGRQIHEEIDTREAYINKVLSLARDKDGIYELISEPSSIRNMLIPIEELQLTIETTRGLSGATQKWNLTDAENFFRNFLTEKDLDRNIVHPSLLRSIIESLSNFWDSIDSAIHEIPSETIEESQHEYFVPPAFLYGSDTDYKTNFDNPDAREFPIGDAVVELRDFFKSVRYLGPLRAEPQDIYPRYMGIKSPQMPLGKDGGYLAETLCNSGSDYAYFPTPKGLAFTTLKKALSDWLVYLGVCKKGVDATTESHYGYRLTVDGKTLRTMGTGVSQVIPVIATCLLAPSGGLVLLEEPELHLNPSIQQKLAEFFVALADANVQVIAETHSEYMITRLRLIAARDPKQASMFSFIFAERDMDAAIPMSIFKQVKANPGGELPPWPEGFFDQVSDDIRDLIVTFAEKNLLEESQD